MEENTPECCSLPYICRNLSYVNILYIRVLKSDKNGVKMRDCDTVQIGFNRVHATQLYREILSDKVV